MQLAPVKLLSHTDFINFYYLQYISKQTFNFRLHIEFKIRYFKTAFSQADIRPIFW